MPGIQGYTGAEYERSVEGKKIAGLVQSSAVRDANARDPNAARSKFRARDSFFFPFFLYTKQMPRARNMVCSRFPARAVRRAVQIAD